MLNWNRSTAAAFATRFAEVGEMPIRENVTITDDMSYGEAQITELNEEEMFVTFIAHRGWGPNGQTIYYIVTDATPTGPAEMMGVVDSPTSASRIGI